DSGPLEAWYVETARAADPTTSIERGMGAQGAVLAVAIAAGAGGAGLLVAWDPWDDVSALAVPVLLALLLQGCAVVATLLLMDEPTRSRAGAGGAADGAAGRAGLLGSVLETPRVVR